VSNYFFLLKGGSRSRSLAEASQRGLSRVGEGLMTDRSWNGKSYWPVVMGYSWMFCHGAFLAHEAKGRKYVYMDLGYWKRRPPGHRWTGYHKLSINGFHPTEYFQRSNPDDRFRKMGVKMQPWQTRGKKIVVIGMSVKAAYVAKLGFEEWEKNIINQIKKVTDRDIIYRAKPNSLEAKPIEGTKFSQTEAIERVFDSAHCVVTHHSNAAVDALAYGVPVYCEQGVGSVMSMKSIRAIENPYYPEDRYQFLSDVAYCQWNVDEIKSGRPWRYFKDQGLLP